MKKVTFSIALLLIFSLVGVGQAHEVGAFGSNGLLTIPTADILLTGDLDVGYQGVAGSNDQDLITGIYGLRKGVQLGAGVKWNELDDDPQLYPTVKVRLLSENNNYRPQVSFGVNDGSDYLVASKMTPYYGVRTHIGIGDQDYFDDHIFAGVSKIINPVTISSGNNNFKIPITTLMAEYNDGVNLGAKFRFEPGIEVRLGTIDLDEFTFGVGFKNKF
ncbi:hypothetical protein JCM16358_13420 [Halanaerocella petrolearia]